MFTINIMSKPFKPMLAHVYDSDKINPKGWYISEKVDGIRAVWTGTELLTRNHKKIIAPDWWLKQLPTIALDGELCIGKGTFQQTCSIVKTKSGEDKGWKNIKYYIFDVPYIDLIFEKRIEKINLICKFKPNLIALQQIYCIDREHLDNLMNTMIEDGGEGLMIRKPGSKYEFGKRSRTLLKIKRFYDKEAFVVEHIDGKGKHKGRLGALLCMDIESNKQFKVGTGFTDKQRESPPPIGSIITYKYQETTKAGIPRFPVFLRIRQ